MRALGQPEIEAALRICDRDPVANVFVAARIIESQLSGNAGPLFGYRAGGDEALCWSSANVVPVEAYSNRAMSGLASKVVKRRAWASSIFGPADQVLDLWGRLERFWGRPREVRENPLVMTTSVRPSVRGVALDEQVRPATEQEVDLVLPAAKAMFTEEIGYPPYQGSGSAYRRGIRELIDRRYCLIRLEEGEVVFKADLGSVALGVAQAQGVWVHPRWRGRGIAVPAMAAVVEYTLANVAPVVTLYVNDYNAPAVATYERVGFTQTGTFATVLL